MRLLKKVLGATTVVLLSACAVDTDDARPGASTALERTDAVCALESLPLLPDVRITSVEAGALPAPHCKVSGIIGTEIGFELLLPDAWNGKFVMGGGGGFAGRVVNLALVYGALQKGYATVGTDTGHRGSGLDASWALNNLERVVNFGHQAVHRTAVTAQALTSGYYGRAPSRNYFMGCSRGGGQGMIEAQRYPDDFDGIVAGAPAWNWTDELGGRNARLNQVMYPDPNDLSVATITPAIQELIGSAVMEQCDLLDGIEDGILNNPLACDFDVTELACGTAGGDACLNPAQLRAAEFVYGGLVLGGEQRVPGYPPGAELGEGGWTTWLTGGFAVSEFDEFQEGVEQDPEYPDPETPNAHFAFGNGVMQYLVFHDPNWDYSTYDFSTFDSDVSTVAPTLNGTNPDLDAFRANGGKLLLFNGWRDMANTPLGTIDYYEQVVDRDPAAAEDVRLVLVPGMDHCIGGPGPSFIDWLDEIDKWVETDQAPETFETFWLGDQMQPDGSRLSCAYPAAPEYDGAGDPREASSFSCVVPE
jgi:feruloyl esterase